MLPEDHGGGVEDRYMWPRLLSGNSWTNVRIWDRTLLPTKPFPHPVWIGHLAKFGAFRRT